MRKVFSSNDVSETMLVQDALEQQGIAVTVQNKYSGRTAVPAFRPPAEIWLQDEADYQEARRIVVATLATLDNPAEGSPWHCGHCGEENPQSFELCWHCGRAKPEGAEPG